MQPVAHQIREQINEHQRQAHQERRGGYQHLNAFGKSGFASGVDYKGGSKSGTGSMRRGPIEESEMPGRDLTDVRDMYGRNIVSDAENKQYRMETIMSDNQWNDDMAQKKQEEKKAKFNPQRTMIRSLDELYQQNKEPQSKFFQPSPIDEPFSGWAPEIQVLTENDIRKIEKQEER